MLVAQFNWFSIKRDFNLSLSKISQAAIYSVNKTACLALIKYVTAFKSCVFSGCNLLFRRPVNLPTGKCSTEIEADTK